MDTAVVAPQQANLAAEVQIWNAAAMRKQLGAGAAASRRKTLCDITNLRRAPAEEGQQQQQQDGSTCSNGVEEVAQLLKVNSELVALLEERDKFIELSGTELQKLRLSNWQLAQANSQMFAELNLGKNRLKSLQHELACSRAALKVKSTELEEAKKAMRRTAQQEKKTANETARNLASDRAAAAATAQVKDGDASGVPASVSRKRMLRSRSLGPAVALTKPAAASKENSAAQRRKSMRPQHSDRREELFEIEDVQLGIGGGGGSHGRSETAEQAPAQFLRRSSLGRPLRRATERVTSYKEMPVNIKLRRS